jgi:hypothetical protein
MPKTRKVTKLVAFFECHLNLVRIFLFTGMLFIYNFLCRCEISLLEEGIETSPKEEAVDKVEPDFDALKKQDGLSILQIPDKLEDISNDLLSRLDYFFHGIIGVL